MRAELINARSERRNSDPLAYFLPNQEPLHVMVDGIVASESLKKTLLKSEVIEKASRGVNPKEIEKTLPNGLTTNDFVGVLKLALLTECATKSYGEIIGSSGERHGQLWLVKYVNEFWIPDELTHFEPYKKILNQYGFSDEELQKEIDETRARKFDYGELHNPLQTAGFGTIQEELTANYHNLIADCLKPAAPEAAEAAYAVTRRERLHMAQYRDMAAAQLAQNPLMLGQLGWALADFRLPGNSIAPEYQKHAREWVPRLDPNKPQNIEKVKKEIFGAFYRIVKEPDIASMLLLDVAVKKDVKTSIVSPRQIQDFLDGLLDRFGKNWGHQFFGEALLQSVSDRPLFETRGIFGPVVNGLRDRLSKEVKKIDVVG